MKTLLWLCIIGFNLSIAVAQGPEDSLRTLIYRSKQADQLWDVQNYTAQLAFIFIQKGQLDSAKKYYFRNLSQEPNGDARFRANILLSLGTIYHSRNRFDSAIYLYRASLELLKSVDDTSNTLTATTNLADALRSIGLYEEALSAALTTLKMANNGLPSFAMGMSYNNIALIQSKLGNYNVAEAYHRKALFVRLQINQPIEVARSYNNIGELFILTHHYDSAARNLHRSADIKRRMSDKKGLAHTLANLGRLSILTEKTSAAESYFEESLAVQKDANDPIGMIEALNGLSELYLLTGQPDEAAKTLQQANTLIHHSGTPDYLRQNLELNIRLARMQKDFAGGMLLLEELLIIRDSLLNEEKSKSLMAMHIRYETQKKEQEIALLEQREEINQARIHNNRILISTLIAGLVLFAVIGVLIYINLKNARAAKARFGLLLAETRHRIKNNLQTLASIFHLQTRHYTDHEMILEARSSESRVHTMSLLHERFYSNEANHIITTRDYITDLVNKIVDIYGAQTQNLKLSIDIDDVELDIDKALALSLIVQELMCNAFKYAFDHEPNPELSFQLYVHSDDIITTIHDNGIGFSGHKQSSNGLSLVNALVAQLDGKIEIYNDNGTTFIIRFPATSIWKRRAFS